MKRKRRKRVSFLGSFEKWFIDVVIGIIFLIIAIPTGIKDISYVISFAKTKGVIMSEHYINDYSVVRSGGRYVTSDRYYTYRVRYMVRGKEYYSDKFSSRNDSLKYNDAVTVQYRKNNPGELKDYGNIIGAGWIFSILGGAAFIWFGIQDRKK